MRDLTVAASLGLAAVALAWGAAPGLRGDPFEGDFRRLHEIRIRMSPEVRAALDSDVPRGVPCRTSRAKGFPLASLEVDGRSIPGRSSVRLRGFCAEHWRGRQRSLKVTAEEPLFGQDALNLDAAESDAGLFNLWAARLLRRARVPATRATLVRVWIDGEYDGVRELVENLDQRLLEAQRLPPGPIYRELALADLGESQAPRQLENLWTRSGPGAGWEDWAEFNRGIAEAIGSGGQGWRDRLDLSTYLRYQAAAAVAGTTHVGNHNIPMHRALAGGRFRPIGNDFASCALATPMARSLPALQAPYAATNRLQALVWSDPSLRRAVHREVAALVSDPATRGAYESLRRSLAHLERELPLADGFDPDERVESLRRLYFEPRALVSPGWKGSTSWQIALDAAGMYALELEPGTTPCGQGETAPVRVRVDWGEWRPAVRCAGGRLEAVPVLVERNGVERPRSGDRPRMMRTGIGAAIVDVVDDAGDVERIELRSLQNGASVPVVDAWPFRVRAEAGGGASLGVAGRARAPLAAQEGSWDLVAPPPVRAHELEGDTVRLRGEEPPAGGDITWWPTLCWQVGGVRGCTELGPALFGRPAEQPPPPARPSLDQASLASCKRLVFDARVWSLTEPLEVAADCEVVFEPGAMLLMGPGSYLVIRGPVRFVTGPAPIVVGSTERLSSRSPTRPAGGLLIDGAGRDVFVQNLHMAGTAEFQWAGERRTAALTILRPGNATVTGCSFADVQADDAINVRGGSAEIRGNRFLGSGDAVDLDGASGLVEGNLIQASRNDGVDLGGSRGVVVRHNIIAGSGDKAVSAGEGSEVLVERNLIHGGNLGVAVKDTSRAVLAGNWIEGMRIALWLGEPWSGAVISGESVLRGNRVDVQPADAEARFPGVRVTRRAGAGAAWSDLSRALEAACRPCVDDDGKLRGGL